MSFFQMLWWSGVWETSIIYSLQWHAGTQKNSALSGMHCLELWHLEGKHLWSSFVAWTWSLYRSRVLRSLPWDHWSSSLLPSARHTCIVCLGLIPFWTKNLWWEGHQNSRKTTQLRERERVAGLLDCLRQLLEHQLQICCMWGSGVSSL